MYSFCRLLYISRAICIIYIHIDIVVQRNRVFGSREQVSDSPNEGSVFPTVCLDNQIARPRLPNLSFFIFNFPILSVVGNADLRSLLNGNVELSVSPHPLPNPLPLRNEVIEDNSVLGVSRAVIVVVEEAC